jgi:hypothetical protein
LPSRGSSQAKLGWNWDTAVEFVASALHDLGLLEKHYDPARTFEAVGTDHLDHALVVKQHMPPPGVSKVRDGIAYTRPDLSIMSVAE